MGNQSAIITANDDNTLNIKTRVPDCLNASYGKFVTINNITLAYGNEEIQAAIRENLKRNQLQKKQFRTEHGDLYKQHGIAINFRPTRFTCVSKQHNPW